MLLGGLIASTQFQEDRFERSDGQCRRLWFAAEEFPDGVRLEKRLNDQLDRLVGVVDQTDKDLLAVLGRVCMNAPDRFAMGSADASEPLRRRFRKQIIQNFAVGPWSE